MAKNKILIKHVGNQDSYNEIDLEKSELFLDNLQDFVLDIGLAKVKIGEYEFEGKSYDMDTYYTLIDQGDQNNDFEIRKSNIDEFCDGHLVRYFNKEIELLIIFLSNSIKLIFYCDSNNKKNIMDALLKFCEIEKVKSK